MTNGVDDDLGFRGLIENQVGVRQGCHATDGRIVRTRADARIKQQKIDDRLYAGMNAPRAEWAAM
jgi:hypothetical protein